MTEQAPSLMVAHLRGNTWQTGDVSHQARRRHYEIVEQNPWIAEALQQQQQRGGWAVAITSAERTLEHPVMAAWAEQQEQVQWHVYTVAGDQDLLHALAS
eukprot:3240928-Amphidinium_carterae.1